jgi:hypothetical protein
VCICARASMVINVNDKTGSRVASPSGYARVNTLPGNPYTVTEETHMRMISSIIDNNHTLLSGG